MNDETLARHILAEECDNLNMKGLAECIRAGEGEYTSVAGLYKASLAAMHRFRSLQSTAGGGEWRDIETAPKDGSRYLIFVPRAATPDDQTTFNLYEACYIGGYDSGDVWHSKGFTIYHPTHWMPSPPAPARSPTEGEKT